MTKPSFEASMHLGSGLGFYSVEVQAIRAAASVTSQGLGLPDGSPNLKRYEC